MKQCDCLQSSCLLYAEETKQNEHGVGRETESFVIQECHLLKEGEGREEMKREIRMPPWRPYVLI